MYCDISKLQKSDIFLQIYYTLVEQKMEKTKNLIFDNDNEF